MKIKNCICTVVFLSMTVILTLLLVFLPKDSYSENEKRVLAEFPTFSFSALLDGSYTKSVEGYISDHFPFRDAFVGINSYSTTLSGRENQNGVYLLGDGSIVAHPGNGGTVDPAKLERYMAMFNSFSDKMGLDAAVMLVPTPGYMKQEMLPAYHLDYYDDKLFDIAINNKGDLNYIDLQSVFKGEEGIYYNTDHHVTGYGSYLMYKEYCKALGLEAESMAVSKTINGFYGTNYSKSGLWLTRPDTIDVYSSDNGYKYKVTVDDITEKKDHDSLYFYSHVDNLDKYPVFLDGNHAITTIENQSNKNGKKLLIVKDSYAHCFSTMVCENYETVVLVDLRYYRGAVSTLVEEYGIDQLLFLFGIENAASISDIGLLR